MGGGTYLVDLLNAVAAITSGGAYMTLAQLAGVAGLAWVLFRTAFGGSWKDNAKWMLLFVTVWGAMIVPKATVRVVDRLDPALAPAVVANVPVGLALFASLTSQVGDGLTRLTEQAFTLPDDLVYQRHGLIFGARLAASATRLEVTDAVFARNLRAYARQCVFHALLLGHVSADDLRESTDIWGLVTATGTPSAGASPARMFEFATRLPAVGTGATPIEREIVTCAVGAGRLNALWNAEIQRAGTIFGRRIFPDARTEALARAELLAALPAAHDFLIGASRSAGEIMRQQMVLNAVHDAGEQWAAEAGNAAALRAYTEARAEAQTVSAYRAIGRQAETWVPLLRIVFECLYVGAFPMAVLLMLTPAGMAIFRSYVTGLVWLQSWGPLYAVLHRISMGEAAERMSAAAAMPGGDVGISLIAQAGIRAVASDVAVMSGYLSMSVPFLAAALAYGLSKATILATSVLAVGQDAASRGRARGHHRQPLARQHRLRHPPLREPRRAPDPHLDACRHRPLHRLRAGRRGVHRRTRRHAGRRCRQRHQPHPGRRGAAHRIARHQPRDPRGRGAHPLAALVGGGRPGAQRRRHRRHGPGRALFARRLDRRGSFAGGFGERERAGAGIAEPCRQAGRDRRHHQEPGGGAHRSGQARRQLEPDREDRRRRLGDVARPDHRIRCLEPDAGIRPPARGDGELVEGRRRLAALLRADRGQRDGEPGRESERQPHAHAALRGARLARAPGIGDLVRSGRAGAQPRAGDRARARPALLRLALRARGRGRQADRRRRRGARRLPADRGGLRTAQGVRGGLHRREVPRAGRTGPGNDRRRGGIRRRGARHAHATPTPARPPRHTGAGRKGCATAPTSRTRRYRARSRLRRGGCAPRRRPT